MLFKATDEQVLKIAALAFNASRGKLSNKYYVPGNMYKSKDFMLVEGRVLKLQVVQGRDVNLFLEKVGDNIWKTPHRAASRKNQTWTVKYKSYEGLVTEVKGVKVVKEDKRSRLSDNK